MPISVLLVDDSEIIRFLFAKSLERDNAISVVATAPDGLAAIALTKQHQPDVIVLDIDMPVMGGIEALPQLLAASPQSRVIMLCSNPRTELVSVFEALRLGAVDFTLKPGAEGAMKPADFNQNLRDKIKALSAGRHVSAPTVPPLPRPPHVPPALTLARNAPESIPALAPQPALPKPTIAVINTDSPPIQLKQARHSPITAIVITAGTGGPESIIQLMNELGHGIDQLPVFITLQMKPLFTAELANQILHRSKHLCKEALSGEIVAPGMAYLAPGGCTMLVRKRAHRTAIQLTQDKPGASPSLPADTLFTSVAESYGGNVLAIVLSGMGNDGTAGAQAIYAAGGSVIAQDAQSSAIDAMPRSVAYAGVCEAILPLKEMGAYILQRCCVSQPA